ncbi:unnamed protein product [Trichobilharzia szidati]|nr:unnamed protein product [Trichobilharzia szidati]
MKQQGKSIEPYCEEKSDLMCYHKTAFGLCSVAQFTTSLPPPEQYFRAQRGNMFGQDFGNNSVCIRHKGAWEARMNGLVSRDARIKATCHQISCSGGLKVVVGGQPFPCQSGVARIQTKQITGEAICPPPNEVCGNYGVLGEPVDKRQHGGNRLKFIVQYEEGFRRQPSFQQFKNEVVQRALDFWERTLSVRRPPNRRLLVPRVNDNNDLAGRLEGDEITEVVEKALNFWSRALSVRKPPNRKLLVQRGCVEPYIYTEPVSGRKFCKDKSQRGNMFGQDFGNNSVCIRHKGAWEARMNGLVSRDARVKATCHQISCSGGLKVVVGGQPFPCQSGVARIQTKQITGEAICPPPNEVCGNKRR